MSLNTSENPLVNYCNERLHVFKIHLTNTVKDFEEESLHQLRVEIKKMRALIRLLAIVLPEGFDRKEIESVLSNIFKPGGKLRETHINKALVIRFDTVFTDDYIAWQNALADKYTGKLKSSLVYFEENELDVFTENLSEIIKRIDYNQIIQSANQFLKVEFNTVKTLFPNANDKKILHKIRMHLKAMGYILKLILELEKQSNKQIFYYKIKTAESFIGDWHDKVVFLQSLQRYFRKRPQFSKIPDSEYVVDKTNAEISEAEFQIKQYLQEIIQDNTFE